MMEKSVIVLELAGGRKSAGWSSVMMLLKALRYGEIIAAKWVFAPTLAVQASAASKSDQL